MVATRGNIIICLLCSFLTSLDASKCPEPRKPHVTSCKIFYNCINLPEGGYVWAPAKCPDGLVFQPYLRICVLPGDTWTCDNLATESSPTAENYEIPGSIGPLRTSYLEYGQYSSPIPDQLTAPVSYTISDSTSELDNVRRIATPYPLIEILEPNDKNNKNNVKLTTNAAVPQTIEHKVENYLYQFFNSQQKFPSEFVTSIENKLQNNRSTWLQGFINKILLYENIGGSSKNENFPLKPVNAGITTNANCEKIVENSPKMSEYLNNFNSDMLSYIVQSYILGTKQSDGKVRKKNKKTPTTTTTTTETNEQLSDEEIYSDFGENSGERPINLNVDRSRSDNNVVGIRGNLGGKEYVTVDKYKSLSSEMTLEILEILPCAKGVRLPNRTDCTKYYTCDPATATIGQFSCSSKTAFNHYNRVCEAQRYKICVKESNASTNKVSTNEQSIAPTLATIGTEATTRKNPCQTTGKFVDPETDRNYYVCYSSQSKSGVIDSIIMTCPNGLIFCQDRRLCTTRKRCYD